MTRPMASDLEPTGERKVRKEWLQALSDAPARREQDLDYRFLTAPEIRLAVQHIAALLAGPDGPESEPVYRAVADLVTMCHPIVLVLLLASVPEKV
jgi:hypothetical protein